MPVETAADRLVFLGDFNDPATYTPQGGTAKDLPGIFDQPFELAADSGLGPGVASDLPQFQCRTADLPASPVDDVLVFDGITYRVARHEADGTGMTMLFLEEQ